MKKAPTRQLSNHWKAASCKRACLTTFTTTKLKETGWAQWCISTLGRRLQIRLWRVRGL